MIHLPIFILLSFFGGALIIPLLARRRPGWAHPLALGAAGIGAVCAGAGLRHSLTAGTIHYHLGGWEPPIGIELILDPLSAFMALIVAGSAFLVLLHSRRMVGVELFGKAVPFYSGTMLLVGGLLGIVITGDLFNLYVFLEISSLAGYAVLSVGDRRAPVSTFRYLILGTAGASFYLLGLAFIFMVTGSLNMADVRLILDRLELSPAITVGLVLVTGGVALKMALFPLHTWLPDAYTHASSAATALVAPIGTKVAAYVLIRIFFYVFNPEVVRTQLPLVQVVGFLGAIGIVWGSVMAIAQSDLKRMLAYSSVGQIGYVALGIGLASPLGLIGALLHVLNHSCMKACLFLVNGNLMLRLGHARIPAMDDSLRQRMPWTTAMFALAAVSMIGLPPTAGFFSKWYLVLGAIEKSQWLFLAAILVSSLLNAVYFFRVLERMYLRKGAVQQGDESEVTAHSKEEMHVRREDVPPSMLIPTVVLGMGVLVLGLLNVWIVNGAIRRMIPSEL